MNGMGGADEAEQLRELVHFFNGINERCFNDCVVNFKTRKLTGQERRCVLACTDKWIQANQRMTRVYAEQQMVLMQEMNDEMAKSRQ